MAATVYYRQGLDGNGSTDLDAIAGATLADNDIAFVMTGTAFYVYKLDASSGAAQSLPNVVAPDSPSGSERWILQTVQNVQTLEYENVTTTTALEVAKTYNDSSGASNAHTLPLLSGTSAGETINLYISGTDRTVTIEEHATDGGTEVWTGYSIGDHVTLVSNGSAWLVQNEYVTVYGRLAKTADETIVTSAVVNAWDTDYSEVQDVGGWWSTSTHRLDIGFDCLLRIDFVEASSIQSSAFYLVPYKNGTAIREANVSATGADFYEGDFDSGDYIEMYIKNGTTSSMDLHGDAALDEAQLQWRVIKRIR